MYVIQSVAACLTIAEMRFDLSMGLFRLSTDKSSQRSVFFITFFHFSNVFFWSSVISGISFMRSNEKNEPAHNKNNTRRKGIAVNVKVLS